MQGAGILYVLAYVLGRHRNTRIFYQWPLLSNVGLCALNCMHSHTNNEYTVHKHSIRGKELSGFPCVDIRYILLLCILLYE